MELFNNMLQQNIKPDTTTLTCVLSSCSHSGLVKQAQNIYNSMEKLFNITPTYEHQACMVDVWGRAGMLEKAETFINHLPTQHIAVWETLLVASRNKGDIQRAQRAASKILELAPHDASTYVLLANTYSVVGNLKKRLQILQERDQQNIKKSPGKTWVIVNGKTETFMWIHGTIRIYYCICLLFCSHTLI